MYADEGNLEQILWNICLKCFFLRILHQILKLNLCTLHTVTAVSYTHLGGYILSLFLYDEVFFPFFGNERNAVQDSADGFKFGFLPDGGCNPVAFCFVIGEDKDVYKRQVHCNGL